jgi:putative endonuclease
MSEKHPRHDSGATGRGGEEAAARFLEARGYVILERNCRLPGGEIDIIAQDGGCLVAVEVKTRRGSRFGSPFEAVDARKQRRLAAAALEYMAMRDLDMPLRFDVAAVFAEKNVFRVELLQNAFECEGMDSQP